MSMLNSHVRNFDVDVLNDMSGLTIKYSFTKQFMHDVMSREIHISMSKDHKNVDLERSKTGNFYKMKEDLTK